MVFELRPVAWVRSSRVELLDDQWDGVSTTVELDDDVPSEALIGLEQFSHLEFVLVADRAAEVPPAPWRRHPRGKAEWPNVGIFAQRNKDRPNRLLVSIARLERIDGRTLFVQGLDGVDGTPVLDIKPVFRWNGPRGEVVAPRWADEIGLDYF